MDAKQKRILRNYFNFTKISTIKEEAQVDTIAEAWQILKDTYNQLVRPSLRLKKVKPKVKINIKTIQKANTKRQRQEQERKREDALQKIRATFNKYVERRRNNRFENNALNGNVRQRTYRPDFLIPYTNANINNLTNMIMTNFYNPIAPQHVNVKFKFYVIKDGGETFWQNRNIWSGNYTRANRAEVIARIRNAINENLNNGFGDTEGYTAYVSNIRLTFTNRNDLAGGCGGSDCNRQGKNIDLGFKTDRWKGWSPSGSPTTNDCLFKCLGSKGSTIRKALNIPIKTPIKIEQIPLIAEHLKIGVRVYDIHKRELVYYGHKFDDQKELMLINQHYILVKDKTKRCEDCGKLWLKTHTCNQNRRMYWNWMNGNKKAVVRSNRYIKEAPINFDEIIYYDFETFIEGASFVVYAAGYFDPLTGKAERFYGKNSLTEFVMYMATQSNKTFIAHNGARFDCYFLINEMLKLNIGIEDIIMNNGAVMTYKFGVGNKMLDSCCFIMSRLADAGKSFKIPEQFYKSEFDHKKITNWEAVDKYKEEVIEYLDLDVYCLKYVWESFSNTIYDKYQIHTIDFITVSSMTYYLWKLVNDAEIYLPSEDELDFINQSKYGANVYPVKKHFKSKEYDGIVEGKIKYEDMTDYLMIMDVVSLYPTSMLNDYPVGQSKWVGERDTSKLGIYDVSFTPPEDILYPQLPRKKNGGIVHSLEKGRGVYNNIDLDRAIDAGYIITKLHKGLEWERTQKVFEPYIRDTFELKCKAKIADDDVMYAISKLLLNGLYGKTLQRPIYKKTQIVNDHEDAIKFLNMVDTIDDAEILNDNFVLYSGEVKPEDKETAITKPTHLGSFVLGYSRSIMYNIIKRLSPDLKEHCFYYTDTDCLHIKGKDLHKIKDLMGDELGELNSDLKKEGRIIEGIYLAPKQYSVSYIGNDDKVFNKYKCKGICNKYLKPEMYKDAISNNGFVMVGTDLHNTNKSTQINMEDSFKKINYKRNSNQKEFNQFSIHLEDIKRTFHKTEWLGRSWNGNCSYPIGHKYCNEKVEQMLGNEFNLPYDITKLINSKKN